MALDGTAKLSIDDAPAAAKDYAKRVQWLRAAILNANDRLVSTASLMMGVSAVKSDAKAMVLSGFAGLVADACSMTIGEFFSVYSQYDIELAQMKRYAVADEKSGSEKEDYIELSNPLQAATETALVFSVGALVPLLATGFIGSCRVRVVVVVGSASAALAVFGTAGAVVGHAPVGRSCARVVIRGWVAMALTFAVIKIFGYNGL